MNTPFETLVERAAARMPELGVPGIAIAVLHQGRVESIGLGVTSVDNPLPMTADTILQVGSISKTFLGTAAMRLVETGALNLDTPARTYLPDLKLRDPDALAAVTMRHLLSHTGGGRAITSMTSAGAMMRSSGWCQPAPISISLRRSGPPGTTTMPALPLPPG